MVWAAVWRNLHTAVPTFKNRVKFFHLLTLTHFPSTVCPLVTLINSKLLWDWIYWRKGGEEGDWEPRRCPQPDDGRTMLGLLQATVTVVAVVVATAVISNSMSLWLAPLQKLYIHAFINPHNLLGQILLWSPFTREETEAQRGYVTCPR